MDVYLCGKRKYQSAMIENWAGMWNQRYGEAEYAYGVAPNAFLKEQLAHLEAGSILFAAEGEGRNAVHAATLGWQVSAFDISVEGQKKALALAARHGVELDYAVGSLESLGYTQGQFDALVLIFAHFPAAIKSSMHAALDKLLRPGGTLILEAFSKNHLAYQARNPGVGGPKDIAQLYSLDEIEADFSNYERLQLVEQEAELDEGKFHQGTASVVRFVGRKR